MSKPSLLLLRQFSPIDREMLFNQLSKYYDIIEPKAFDDQTLSDCAHNADVALGSVLSQKVLSSAIRLKYLQTPSSGVDKIDLVLFQERGITVCNSASHAPYVAEHGIALLLALMRKVALHDRLLRQGKWYRPSGRPDDADYQSDTLHGANVGLIGYGAINQAIAKLLCGFNVKIQVYARRQRQNIEMATLKELMKNSIAVIVALPLTPKTRDLINSDVLSYGNPYIVNLGRAEVINYNALINALRNHDLRGVAIDVPYGDADTLSGLKEFTELDNVIVSPHRAGTIKGMAPHLSDVVENLVAYAQGRQVKNIITLSDYC